MGTKQLSETVIGVFVEMISGTVYHLQKTNPKFDRGIFYRELLKRIRERAEQGPHRFSNRREVREQFDVGAQNDARFGGTLDETGE